MFGLVGVRSAILRVTPCNNRIRMRSDGGVYVMEVREYRNFMASRLQLCFSLSSGFILLPNLHAQFLLITVIGVSMK